MRRSLFFIFLETTAQRGTTVQEGRREQAADFGIRSGERGERVARKIRSDMVMDVVKASDRLLLNYQAYYNITPDPSEAQTELKAFCTFHKLDEKFVLTHKAQLWETNEHEYAYLFQTEVLDEEKARHMIGYALEQGQKEVKPQKDHMASYITCVILCSRMTPEAARVVRKSRFYKSFRFSWYGWEELRCAAAPMSGGPIVSNRAGRSTADFLYRVFKTRKH